MTLSLNDAISELKKSKRFREWGKLTLRDLTNSDFSANEKHYTPQELAEMWAVSVQTVRQIFENEEGVLKIGREGTRTRRRYTTLRIPESVVDQVHAKLSAPRC